MAFTFDNLIFNRIILHNVYKPNDEGRVNPFPSRELTQLVGAGLDVSIHQDGVDGISSAGMG